MNKKSTEPRNTPWINPADLMPSSLEARVRNVNSDEDWNSSGGIQVLEFGQKSVCLEAPDKLCAISHHVLLILKITSSEPSPVVFTSTARISAINPEPGGRAAIELTLLQYDKATWSALQAVLAGRQQKMQKLLERIRGVG